jgi:hypothetical protein
MKLGFVYAKRPNPSSFIFILAFWLDSIFLFQLLGQPGLNLEFRQVEPESIPLLVRPEFSTLGFHVKEYFTFHPYQCISLPLGFSH